MAKAAGGHPRHLFEAMKEGGMIRSYLCLWYPGVDEGAASPSSPAAGPAAPPSRAAAVASLEGVDPAEPCYHAVFALGDAVCGYPGVLHGGLCAALMDEALGGMLFALKLGQAGRGAGPPRSIPRPVPMPGGAAYTVNLSVQYKDLVPANVVVVAAVRVDRDRSDADGRKVWLSASLTDVRGPVKGKTFATATGLFVHPRRSTMVRKAVSGVATAVKEAARGVLKSGG